MKIKLLGWESHGLRCPDIKIDLGTPDNIPKIALIQMPNGTGKTTTLNLIRAALTGEAKDWDIEKILQLRKRDDFTRSSGRFILNLAVDQQPLTFDLAIDFVNGTVKYRTSSASIGGVVPDYSPPSNVRRFLNSKFTNLFVFDGEYAFRLLNEHESRAEEAIDALCQLDLLDLVRSTAELAWQRETKNKGAKTQQGLSGYKNKEITLQKNIRKIQNYKIEAETKLKDTQAEISNIENTIGNKIKESERYRKEREELKLQEKDCENSLERAVASAMSFLRQPQLIHKNFLTGLVALKLNLDKAKLPDVTSRQFFVELAEEDVCVCGRPIGHDERHQILSQTNRYLGNEISGIINAMKQDIDAVNASSFENSLDGAIGTLAEADKNYHLKQTERQLLEQQALEESGSDVTTLRSRLEELNRIKEKLNDVLTEINRSPKPDDDEASISLLSLERQLEVVRKYISEITETVELKEKVDIINKLALNTKAHARAQIKEALINECNKNLQKILAADPIAIEKIDKSIFLSGQREASVGQTLAVGYTFLTAALSRGKHQFPLIVDSPAGPLDDNVRKEIGEMVPMLCEQFLAFTISTERENFLPALERSAGDNIKYLTVFRNNVGTAHLIKELPKDGVSQSENAVIVDGREYFTEFSIVKESEE